MLGGELNCLLSLFFPHLVTLWEGVCKMYGAMLSSCLHTHSLCQCLRWHPWHSFHHNLQLVSFLLKTSMCLTSRETSRLGNKTATSISKTQVLQYPAPKCGHLWSGPQCTMRLLPHPMSTARRPSLSSPDGKERWSCPLVQ